MEQITMEQLAELLKSQIAGQARMEVKWDADKAEERTERKADKEESKAERKADKAEMMAWSVYTLHER
jgi:hypothetical protein